MFCDALPCSPVITLFGGFSQVRIVEPNGGEKYSICGKVNIKWAGVDEKASVSLYYNNGSTDWVSIGKSIKGLHYTWTPPASGNNYKN